MTFEERQKLNTEYDEPIQSDLLEELERVRIARRR